MNEELSPELQQMDAVLRRAAAAMRYPPTPPMAQAVFAQLDATPARRWLQLPAVGAWWRAPVARAATAALGAALLVLAVALAVPTSRTALADFFGLSHVRVETEPSTGPTPPVLSPEAFAVPATLAEAQNAVDFTLRLPTRGGERIYPDAAYVQDGGESGVVILVYEDEGYDLYQTRGGFFGKGLPDESLIHELEFDGHAALWIDQGGHIAQFLDEQGRVAVESRRTVELSTLLWEENDLTYRLETSLSQEQAIKVARSLR